MQAAFLRGREEKYRLHQKQKQKQKQMHRQRQTQGQEHRGKTGQGCLVRSPCACGSSPAAAPSSCAGSRPWCPRPPPAARAPPPDAPCAPPAPPAPSSYTARGIDEEKARADDGSAAQKRWRAAHGVERREGGLGVGQVGVRVGVEQRLRQARVALRRRDEQRRLAVARAAVHIGARRNLRLELGEVAVEGGLAQLLLGGLGLDALGLDAPPPATGRGVLVLAAPLVPEPVRLQACRDESHDCECERRRWGRAVRTGERSSVGGVLWGSDAASACGAGAGDAGISAPICVAAGSGASTTASEIDISTSSMPAVCTPPVCAGAGAGTGVGAGFFSSLSGGAEQRLPMVLRGLFSGLFPC